MPNFKTRISWLFVAIITVGLIVLVANGFYSDFWIPVAAEEVDETTNDTQIPGEASLLGIDEMASLAESTIETPEDLELQASVPPQNSNLHYGSSTEVFRFALNAKGPYAVRYIGFDVDFTGLQNDKLNSDNWKLYLSNGGEVDYENLVGHGERLVDGELKVRLEDGRGKAFVCDKGKTEFVLKTYVLTDKESEEDAMISVQLAEHDWSFVPGYFADAWLTLDEKFGEEFVKGLPSDVVVKK